MVDRKGPPIVFWISIIALGFLGVYRVTQSPNFEIYRVVDIIQLVGSGACIGAALGGAISTLVHKRT
jgi:drug/metabolite transporter (DMT)-like permease